MAGQLTIDTLKASSGVLATQNGMTGIAKAWVNFVGSSASINGSFNVSSVTRGGAGIYTINFTTAMSNANYAACITVGTNSGGFGSEVAPITYNTSSLLMYSFDRTGNTTQDPTTVNIAIFSS